MQVRYKDDKILRIARCKWEEGCVIGYVNLFLNLILGDRSSCGYLLPPFTENLKWSVRLALN